MPTTPVEVLLAHGLAPGVVTRLGERFSRVEDIAAAASRHEAGQCGNPFGDPRGDIQCCPWHVPWALAGDLEEVTRAVDAWIFVGWAERGLFERERPGDAGPR